MGGMMDVTGFADGLPTKVGPAIADNYTGALLAIDILMAPTSVSKPVKAAMWTLPWWTP